MRKKKLKKKKNVWTWECELEQISHFEQQKPTTSVFISCCQKCAFRFDWKLEWSDRAWREKREVIKDSQSGAHRLPAATLCRATAAQWTYCVLRAYTPHHLIRPSYHPLLSPKQTSGAFGPKWASCVAAHHPVRNDINLFIYWLIDWLIEDHWRYGNVWESICVTSVPVFL